MKAEQRIIIKKKAMARAGQHLSASSISDEAKAIAAVLDDIIADMKALSDRSLSDYQKNLLSKLNMAIEMGKL